MESERSTADPFNYTRLSHTQAIYLYRLETVAMIDKQQDKLQVCENNWVRRIVEVKGIDDRRMEALREEVSVRESHEEAGEEPAKVGWTCGKNGERLMAIVNALRVEGRRRRGRPRLRWEDCVKGDLAVVGGELRMRARDRRRVQTVVGKGIETGLVMNKKGGKSTTGIGASLTPDYGGKEESTDMLLVGCTFMSELMYKHNTASRKRGACRYAKESRKR